MTEDRQTIEDRIGDEANLEPPADPGDVELLDHGLRHAGLSGMPAPVAKLLCAANGMDFGVGRIAGLDALPPRIGGTPFPDLYDLNKANQERTEQGRYFLVGETEDTDIAFDTQQQLWVERDTLTGEVYESAAELSLLIAELLKTDRPLG